MKQIKKYSAFLTRAFLALAFLYPLAGFLAWSFFSKLPQNTQWEMSSIGPDKILWNTKAWFLVELVNLPYYIISGIVFWKLSKIFQSFSQGKVFALNNCLSLKNLSKYLCLSVFFKILGTSLTSLALTFQNPPGERFWTLSFGTDHLTTLLMALVVYVISMVQAEACRLAEESKLTV